MGTGWRRHLEEELLKGFQKVSPHFHPGAFQPQTMAGMHLERKVLDYGLLLGLTERINNAGSQAVVLGTGDPLGEGAQKQGPLGLRALTPGSSLHVSLFYIHMYMYRHVYVHKHHISARGSLERVQNP